MQMYYSVVHPPDAASVQPHSALNPATKTHLLFPEATKHRVLSIFYVYVYGSVHRWFILIIAQRDASQSSLFITLQVHSTCFGCQPHPSSGVHKTVTTASGTGHFFVQLPPSNVAKLGHLEGGSYTVPEAVVTVLCSPDDGCGWHPKHLEWTCRIINRLLCVASRWTISNISLNILTVILIC